MHKSRHNFRDTLNPLFSSSLGPASTVLIFVLSRNYANIPITLMNELNNIDNSITSRQPVPT